VIPRVASVEVLDGYRVRLAFTDGMTGVVDLEPDMWGPVFEPLLRDRRLFEAVTVDSRLGTIVWPNGADWDPDVLHARVATNRESAAP
jgi:hypothetical protein